MIAAKAYEGCGLGRSLFVPLTMKADDLEPVRLRHCLSVEPNSVVVGRYRHEPDVRSREEGVEDGDWGS